MDDARTDVESSPEDAAAVVEDETADPELVPSASPDCDPNTTLPPQLNGFSVEKLHELLQQVERLRSEQELLRQDQESWNATAKERDELKTEVQRLQHVLVKTEEQWQERSRLAREEHEQRLDKLSRERDSMTVKYACSESSILAAQNQRQAAEKKSRDLAKERDVLLDKVKALNAEKARVGGMLEAKCNEFFNAQREMEKMKDEINSREIKVRWGQNKLKAETENHKETQTKLEKSQQQVRQLKEELEEVKRGCAEMMQAAQTAGGISHQQLLEEKARLIMDKQAMDEQLAAYNSSLKEFDHLRALHTKLVDDNRQLADKIQALEKEHHRLEQENGRLKEQATEQRQDLIQCQTRLAEMDGVQTQLERERQRLATNQEEMEEMRQRDAERQVAMDRCLAKESELLEFTQRLTEKNVQLQSTLTSLEERTALDVGRKVELDQQLDETTGQLKSLRLQLDEERRHRSDEAAIWAQSVADKSRLCEDLQTQTRELNNELASVKRKHQVNLKELTRELRVAKKRLEQAEAGGAGGVAKAATAASVASDALSMGSRASSSTSLNTAGIDVHPSPDHESPSPDRGGGLQHPPTGSGSSGDGWERNALLEKMVRVQRDNARKGDKIDFLEEHVAELVNELQKKNRILQMYLVREESGVLATEASDRHKAELAKHAGVMSSMYNQKGMDSELSLELCLEINRKLQGVLEDTLLKNITLKDNLSTLGAEVARITRKHQSLLSKMQQQQNLPN